MTGESSCQLNHDNIQTRFCAECGRTAESILLELRNKKREDLVAKLNELYTKYEATDIYTSLKTIYSEITNLITDVGRLDTTLLKEYGQVSMLASGFKGIQLDEDDYNTHNITYFMKYVCNVININPNYVNDSIDIMLIDKKFVFIYDTYLNQFNTYANDLKYVYDQNIRDKYIKDFIETQRTSSVWYIFNGTIRVNIFIISKNKWNNICLYSFRGFQYIKNTVIEIEDEKKIKLLQQADALFLEEAKPAPVPAPVVAPVPAPVVALVQEPAPAPVQEPAPAPVQEPAPVVADIPPAFE
jgi:hypothetical protein